MAENDCREWAVVRLVTMQKKGEMGRLLFTTITELTQGRSLPTTMSGVDVFKLKGSDDRLFFRRVILSKAEAVDWYRSLGDGERKTPVPTRENDRTELDGVPIMVSRLEDVQPWPALGLPIAEDLFSGPRAARTIDPAPFIGSVPGRLHRRFGERSGLEAFLEDALAQAFVARRMHINLFEYREYLGSAVYIAPDPVIRQIDYFMVPAKNGQGERIVYRVVPPPGQSREGVRVPSFDKEARLLTSFETRALPANGILDVEKGTCMGEYGFVVSHDRFGVLAYQPSVPFLRQINFSIRATPRSARTISVPSGDSADSPRTEYPAAMGSELASKSVLGEVRNPGASVRVAVEAMRRERLADAKRYGQRWFDEDTRDEATHFIRELLREARSRVMIADPYLGTLQLGQFLYAVHGSEVSVTLLTTRLAFNPTASVSKLDLLKSFKEGLDALSKYQKLVPDIRILPSSSLHDRFLVVDDDVWFVGTSLNSLGEKASMIVRLPNSNEVIERLQKLAAKAPSLDAYIGTLPNGDQEGANE